MSNTIEYAEKILALQKACQNFVDGWSHFCGCINFGTSGLDADAIRWMNETPGEIETALKELK